MYIPKFRNYLKLFGNTLFFLQWENDFLFYSIYQTYTTFQDRNILTKYI